MDKLTPEQRHKNMAAIKGKDTGIEILVRKYLFSKGFRYRKNMKTLPGKPDIAFPGMNTVIFIHGCFWHGHDECRYATIPSTRTEFWTAKIARNKERDREVLALYHDMGWTVITVMECELKPKVRENTLLELAEKLETLRCNTTLNDH